MKKYNRKEIKITDKEMEILKALDKKQNGAYFKIQYMTDINNKVAAAFRGHNVTKLTTMSVRKGISYDNLKSVKQATMGNNNIQRKYTPWYSHIDKMLLKHNTKDQYYVALFPNKFGKPKTIYMLNGKPISKQELQDKGIMQPSYWNQSENNNNPKMITLGLDKIIQVYKKGV